MKRLLELEDHVDLLLATDPHALLHPSPGFLPKTCRRGKPTSWPFLPERRAETETRRASLKRNTNEKTATSGLSQPHDRNPQYSQRFPVVPRRLRRHGSMPDMRGARRSLISAPSLPVLLCALHSCSCTFVHSLTPALLLKRAISSAPADYLQDCDAAEWPDKPAQS
ncbi:unnamed protein product [Pleuronectes platessa]|uniref:Uncharacterized protein n=1 Tax=Pleuronectes platessa TaxID=8262 RepID=A0A9N7TM90_PLEPL|nr:unnamed protein product [Pleuronectes platessa]